MTSADSARTAPPEKWRFQLAGPHRRLLSFPTINVTFFFSGKSECYIQHQHGHMHNSYETEVKEIFAVVK